MRVFGVVVFGFLVCLASEQSSAAEQRRAVAPHERALWWLPVDTETVVFAKGALPPPRDLSRYRVVTNIEPRTGRITTTYIDAETGRPVPALLGPTFAEMAVESNLSLFTYLTDSVSKRLAKQHVWFTLVAARNFGPVTSIPGGSPSESCAIAVFKDKLDPRVFAEFEKRATRIVTIAGFRTVQVKTNEKRGGANIVLYFAQPMTNVLVAGNNLGFLTTLLQRINTRGKTRALPKDLPEWEHVDTTVASWGVRHFRTKIRDEKATGITYAFQKETNSVMVHYVSQSDDRDAIATKILEELMGDKVRATKRDGAVAFPIPITADRPQSVGTAHLTVAWLMGWVVAL